MEPSPCSNQEFCLLSTEYPVYLAERYDRWNLGQRMVAEIDWSLFKSEEISNVYKKSKTIGLTPLWTFESTLLLVNVKSAAIGVCCSVLHDNKLIDCYIRIDVRLSASCCSRLAISERLKLLLSELKVGNYSGSGLFDQERFDTIDRLWLEQRLYEIDGDTDRDPITLETQLSDHLQSVYDCKGLTKSLTAILLIGESSLINKVMNTQPFHASPRVPKPNEFFRTDRRFLVGIKGSHYIRKFLGSIDVNPNHKKAQAPTLPVSPPVSRSSLKRGSETDSGVDSYVKRINTQSEPESEDIYNQLDS